MPFVEANGERIHYEVEGEGPAVLFIHGLGSNVYMWRDQVAALKDRYTCVRAESRGHGETSYNTVFTVAGVAADHKAVLDDLGIATCHIIRGIRSVTGSRISIGCFIFYKFRTIDDVRVFEEPLLVSFLIILVVTCTTTAHTGRPVVEI